METTVKDYRRLNKYMEDKSDYTPMTSLDFDNKIVYSDDFTGYMKEDTL